LSLLKDDEYSYAQKTFLSLAFFRTIYTKHPLPNRNHLFIQWKGTTSTAT